MAYRTHNCNELTLADLEKTVSLAGWVDTVRDHGGVIFIDLRDQYGITQVVVNDDSLMQGVHKESVISVTGKVVKRDEDTVNKKIPTGELEIRYRSLKFSAPALRLFRLKLRTRSIRERIHVLPTVSLI